MKLLFGGAYNGKLRYVREKLGINEYEIFYCKEDSIDFSKKVISGIDRLIYFFLSYLYSYQLFHNIDCSHFNMSS